MAGFEKLQDEFHAEGISVFAAAVDGAEDTLAVQKELSFPVAYGVTKDDADKLGAWWDERRGFIQPSEFILRRDGRVLSATYSTGPVGRLDAGDALGLVKILVARSKKGPAKREAE